MLTFDAQMVAYASVPCFYCGHGITAIEAGLLRRGQHFALELDRGHVFYFEPSFSSA